MRHADFPDGPLVVVQQRRCLLVLGEAELLALLKRTRSYGGRPYGEARPWSAQGRPRGGSNLQEPEGRDRRPGFA
ncbi:MAG: hypothetical protein QME76_09285 [Bacillota bacterium]|nr:hypothetical protein [Bacillota bacterium]